MAQKIRPSAGKGLDNLHRYDECRYVLMEHPISPPRRTARPPVGDDPLELHRQARFYRI